MSAILIGDRAGLDADVERRLQEAGTYHVIAISGGNIAILAGLCIFLLRVGRAGPRSSALLVIVMLTAYAFVVEGGSSVGRATLMAAIYFAAQLCDHRTLPLNVAALTAAILFCADPLQVVDAGFALTFGATLGILVGMSKVADVLPASPWLRAPAALLVASACAEIALLPVSAFVFSRVTFAGLIVNFAAIPLMTLVQIAGMAAVGLTWLSPESRAMGRLDRASCGRGAHRQRRARRLVAVADATACASAAVGHGRLLRVSDCIAVPSVVPTLRVPTGGRLATALMCDRGGRVDCRTRRAL